MDTNNWRPNQGGSSGGGNSSLEPVDWRNLLAPGTRQKLVNKLTDDLKKHVQFSGQEKLHELKDFALRIEEKFYTAAKNHEEYIRKISMKLMTLGNRSANPAPNSPHSNSACNTANSSDPGSQGMQQINNQGQTPPVSVSSNHSQAGKQMIIHNNVSSSVVPSGSCVSHSTSQNSSLQNIQNLNNMGHGIHPSNFVSQRQIPGSQNSQHYLYQQQQAYARQKLQQNSINNNNNNDTTSVQSHTHQHQNILQHAHFQPSQLQPTLLQPSLSTIKQNQQPHFPQAGQTHQQMVLRQQRQQQQQQPRVFSQQNNLSNVQSTGQHNNFSSIHQQHTQSANSTMLNNQHPSHLMQSTQSQRSQVEIQQQQQVIPQLQTQSAQFQHQLNMKQRLSASFHQPRVMAEASSTSSDSTAQTGNPNSGDWREEVYQKVKAMKDKYFLELNDMYQMIMIKLQQHDSLPQQPNGDQVEGLKRYKQMLENLMKFLQLPKNNIIPKHKDILSGYERQIVNLISRRIRKPGPTPQQQHMSSLHQSQQSHENQMNSLHHNNNLATLHHKSVSRAQQNMMSILQQQQSNSNMHPQQQLKQLQSRQMQHQLMHKQQLLHQHQLHQQTKHNPKMKMNQVMQLHQRNDVSELKAIPQIEMKSDSSLKQLKIEQENVSSPVNKTSTPLQPANSPFIASSPSTPSMSNLPGDTDKVNSSVLLPSSDGNVCTPGISSSPLLAECTNPDVNHASIPSEKSSTIEQPLENLLRVVKSISAKSLHASVRDIDLVLSDSIAEPPPCKGSRTAIDNDSVAKKNKRSTSPLFINVVSSPSNVYDSLNHSNNMEHLEAEYTATTSTVKRPRFEMKHPLLEEIREINQRLIDTVVDISQENAAPEAASEFGKGTIVKCSYSAVALCPDLKSQYASMQMSPIQPLRLLVPTNYPHSSPILLDDLPVEVSKENEDLSLKAKWRFNSCVRMLSDPMSLEKMARTWDDCARTVILERVQQNGGGTFSSKYGAWEDCLTAA